MPPITDGVVLEVNRREITEPIYFTGVKNDMPVQFMDGLGIESGVDPLDALWQNFHEQKLTVLGLAENNEEICVAYPCLKEGYFSYFAGAKSSPEEVQNGFMNWELPPGKYIVCSFEVGNFTTLVMDALYKAQQYVYNTWMPNHKLQTEAFCAELYKSHSPKTTNMEIWLKLI